ncbi:SpoIIE family protein phosphatase [Kineococcus sp. TBRC 1896]|uniref:SpoIIE family protein phosphatase n=1 Tax=Kineococcus mangrovi TaxID=1660183 RepID=A0ABV4I3I5_9ACTN
MDEDLRRGLLKLSSDVLQGTMRAAEAIEPTVTPAQLRVLAVLADGGPLTVSALAAHLGVAVSTASRLGDRLSGAGLLIRQNGTDNRREVELALTRRGRLVAGRWADARVEVLSDLLAQLEHPARRAVEDGVRVPPPQTASPPGTPSAPARPEGAAGPVPEPVRTPAWARADATSPACHRLSGALRAADPHTAPDVLVTELAEVLDSAAVVLRVRSPDGRVLRPVSWRGPADAPAPREEPVDRSPAGQALRLDDLVVEVEGEVVVAHAPLTRAAQRLGVVSVHWQAPAGQDDPGASAAQTQVRAGPPERWSDLLLALVATAGAQLEAASTGSRRMHLASRTQEWTVAAEIQARQSGPGAVAVLGARAAAHTEPSASGGAEAHDLEVVTAPAHRDGRPGTVSPVHLDLALVDCRSRGRQAAAATGLALGALRHARSLGLDLPEQARLVDQAVFGEHRGEHVVDVLLLRVDFDPWRVHVLASPDTTVHLQRDTFLQELDLPRHDPLGLTGEADYRAVSLDLTRGQRLLVTGDGFGPVPQHGRRRVETVANRLRDLSADEVVRQVITDLLETAGPDGPDEDATVVCLDL